MSLVKEMKILWLVLVGMLLLGCGGSSTNATNIYEGTYSGTWANADDGTSGTLTLAVTAQGAVSGTLHHTQLDQNGTLKGTISSTGVYAMSAALTSSTVQGSGLAGMDGNSDLSGDATSGFSFVAARQ